MVRYEDLIADTPGTMRRVYSTLGIPADEADLARVVEKHAWEKISEKKKGPASSTGRAAPAAGRRT